MDFEIREKEVRIAQKTRSCKRKRRMLARLGEKLGGAKEDDTLCDKKTSEPVSGGAAAVEKHTQQMVGSFNQIKQFVLKGRMLQQQMLNLLHSNLP